MSARRRRQKRRAPRRLVRLSPLIRDRIVAELKASVPEDVPIPTALKLEKARRHGVSMATINRWLRVEESGEERKPRPAQWQLTEEVLDAIKGAPSVAQALRNIDPDESRVDLPSPSTIYDRLRAMDADKRAALSRGELEVRKKQIHPPRGDQGLRPGDKLAVDMHQCKHWVRLPNGSRMYQPWVVACFDWISGYVAGLGFFLDKPVNGIENAATIASSFLPRWIGTTEMAPTFGLVVGDNGGEEIAAIADEILAHAGIPTVDPTESRSPWQNRIERFWQEYEKLAWDLPGHMDNATTRSGDRHPVRYACPWPYYVATMSQRMEERNANTRRSIRAARGRTIAEHFVHDYRPRLPIPESLIATASLETTLGSKRQLHAGVLDSLGLEWTGPSVVGQADRDVVVGVWPNSIAMNRIEVFRLVDDFHLGPAHHTLSGEQYQELNARNALVLAGVKAIRREVDDAKAAAHPAGALPATTPKPKRNHKRKSASAPTATVVAFPVQLVPPVGEDELPPDDTGAEVEPPATDQPEEPEVVGHADDYVAPTAEASTDVEPSPPVEMAASDEVTPADASQADEPANDEPAPVVPTQDVRSRARRRSGAVRPAAAPTTTPVVDLTAWLSTPIPEPKPRR